MNRIEISTCLIFSWYAALAFLGPPRPAAAELDTEKLKRVVPKITAHKPRRVTDVGAGVVLAVDKDEVLIVTAYHVIEDAEEIEVVFYERTYQSFPARIFHRVSESLDVAVLIADVENAMETLTELPMVDLGRSSTLEEGDRVYPLGHPLDSSWQMSRDNTVEALIHEGDTRQLRFTLGSIEKGNSGGPIFDERGALMGIVARMHPIHGVAVKSDAIVSLLEDWNIPMTNLKALPELGTLIIDTLPSEARIVLDGEDAGTSRDGTLRIEEVAPGAHTIEVSKPPGYRSLTLEVDVAAGETQRVVAQLPAVASQSTFLVAVAGPPGEADPGLDSAAATLLGRLTQNGYSVIDQGQTARILRSEGVMETLRGADPVRIAAIAQQNGAEVILVGRLESEAQPAMGRFFSGRAVLDLRCFRASTGQYLAAETLRVGDAGEPGKLGPSELMARTEASKAVAEMAAERVIELVVPQLQEASRRAADEAGEAAVGRQRLVIVALGTTLGEARELRALLDARPRVTEIRQTSFVNGERLELALTYEGEAVELGETLDGAEIGGRRLGLEQAEPRRLTFRLQEP